MGSGCPGRRGGFWFGSDTSLVSRDAEDPEVVLFPFCDPLPCLFYFPGAWVLCLMVQDLISSYHVAHPRSLHSMVNGKVTSIQKHIKTLEETSNGKQEGKI